MARPRPRASYGLKPGDLVTTNIVGTTGFGRRVVGFVVASSRLPFYDDGPEWCWHIVVNNRLIKTSAVSTFTVVQV
jgi:hypothetical protein